MGPVPVVIGGAVRQLVDSGTDGVERGLRILERRRTSRIGGVSGADDAQVRCACPHPLRVCAARENT